MNDQFTETTTTSWGSRITSSIKGIFLGLLMFFISFGVLYWNEGRIDLSKLAEKAIDISSTSKASADTDKQLISVNGVFSSNEMIGDSFLKKGNYISIKRNVEMYSWNEETSTKSKTNTGGSETTETTYTYKKEWTSMPADSADFKKPEDHFNPAKTINSNSVKVQNAKLGIYDIDTNSVSIPSHESISLNKDILILPAVAVKDSKEINPDVVKEITIDGEAQEKVKIIERKSLHLANEKYLFEGMGAITAPTVGDIRISYSVVPNPISNATVFGQLNLANNKIDPFYGPKDAKLYRVFKGTRETAISKMSTEHTIMTWVLRAVGFSLMWFGLMSLFAPLSVILDVLPMFGSIRRALSGFVTFVIALLLSIITILVSMVIHNIIVLILIIIGFVAGIVWYLKNKNKKLIKTDTSKPKASTE